MSFDLVARLSHIIEKAVSWAEAESSRILSEGQPLDARMIALAESVGVANAENIRILEVPHLPMPDDEELQQASFATGLLGGRTDGLSLGYGIVLRQGHGTTRLLSHEFRHVHQFEQAGSMAAFLGEYIPQIIQCGYAGAALERDACAHERSRV
ncbi:MAG: hypothetical protein ACM3SV_08685 [Betaproteobacteria bacterium]